MPVPLDYVVAALVTLLVVVDPVGLTPAFLGVTAGLPRPARRHCREAPSAPQRDLPRGVGANFEEISIKLAMSLRVPHRPMADRPG